MPRAPYAKSKLDEKSLAAMLRERLKTGKSLVYFASGRRVRKEYYVLPYDHIVLVDYNFRSTFAVRGKVIIIGMTALQATAAFKEAGLKFDAFVCINEGLNEGGGYYAINGNWSMGTILPILKDTYLHIACPTYYGRTRWREKLFNLPQQADLLDATHPEYINPSVFSDYSRYGDAACVWSVTKQPGKAVSFNVGNRTLTLQHKNIWDDYDMLDMLMVRCSPTEERQLQLMAPKAQPLYRPRYYRSEEQDASFEAMLHYCNLHRIEKLGLTPWLGGNYTRFLNYLQAHQDRFPYPQSVYLYHLHRNDYRELYKLAEDTEIPVQPVEIQP
ncbi:recombinase family protein [Pontibacter sp. HSC-14F20]|uniref:recombinase family protein n=1 Tax=Pontibacter sp. HSC-14F20 TaxID=2864136 RepID=UPI001C73BD67|nr:recombinase family protein [Pontibacter sp. HSC-14F20]MBX0333008.1 recombinase family protein [Pontibacter sp. HSC-14F20]